MIIRSDYDNIPSELKQNGLFCLWRYEERATGGKPTKIPYQINGYLAASTIKEHFTDFCTAVSYSNDYDGIGLGIFDGFCAVDIDHCIDENGAFSDVAADIIGIMQSYTEKSPSGNGVRIIFRAKELFYDKAKYYINNQKLGLEIYVSGATNKYVTLTGNVMCDLPVLERSAEIAAVMEKYMKRSAKTEPSRKFVRSSAQIGTPASVSDILEAARNAKNGAAFSALYAGDISGYASQSEADMALCNMLAFWCRCDAELMDTMYRQSGLMREKWDRQQSGSTYGALTIQKAVEGCTSVYQPRGHSDYRLNVHGGEVDILPKLYTFDDTGNADRFIDMFGQDMRYNYAEKSWLYWDGRRWAYDMDGTAARAADCSVAAMSSELEYYERQEDDTAKQFAKHIKYSRSHKGKKALTDEAQHRVPVLPHQLDKHLMAFNTPNGTLSLKTGELAAHDPKWLITKMSNVEYTDTADHPLWDRFLMDIFGGNRDLIRYVQKAVGYSLTGRTDEQCAFFLFGTGRNGKSTFLDVIRDIVGDYAMNIQPETLMVRSSQSSGISSDIARLKGARLVTSVEPNEGVRINEGLLKQLTGDDTVTARKLYCNEFEFKPEFKLWMATNHKPIIRGTDTGIWRRIHMIPFTVQIPPERIDRQLKDKLRREYAAILHWAVEGCLLWQSEGLQMPRAVMDMVREYRREMDVISAFLEDRCETADFALAQATALYSSYTAWCDANNEYKMSNTKFGIELAKRFKKIKQREGWYYSGLRILR